MIAGGGRRPAGCNGENMDPDADAPETTTPEQITGAVIASFEGCADPRLRELMQALVRHAHALVREVELTPAEWQRAIEILTVNRPRDR